MSQHISVVIKPIATPPIPDTNDHDTLGIASGVIDHQISLKETVSLIIPFRRFG